MNQIGELHKRCRECKRRRGLIKNPCYSALAERRARKLKFQACDKK